MLPLTHDTAPECIAAGLDHTLQPARLLGEEAWLQGELRKAELRRRIAELAASERALSDPGAAALPPPPLRCRRS